MSAWRDLVVTDSSLLPARIQLRGSHDHNTQSAGAEYLPTIGEELVKQQAKWHYSKDILKVAQQCIPKSVIWLIHRLSRLELLTLLSSHGIEFDEEEEACFEAGGDVENCAQGISKVALREQAITEELRLFAQMDP